MEKTQKAKHDVPSAAISCPLNHQMIVPSVGCICKRLAWLKTSWTFLRFIVISSYYVLNYINVFIYIYIYIVSDFLWFDFHLITQYVCISEPHYIDSANVAVINYQLFLKSLRTAATTMMMITSKISTEKHIHFREFLCNFLTFLRLTFALWTCSTALVTWKEINLMKNVQQKSLVTVKHLWMWINLIQPEFQCHSTCPLVHQPVLTYLGTSVEILRFNHKKLFKDCLHMQQTCCKSRSFFSSSRKASRLSWISANVSIIYIICR